MNSQLSAWVNQIQEMFPQMGRDVILTDLRDTHAMEATIDNIIEGRLVHEVRVNN